MDGMPSKSSLKHPLEILGSSDIDEKEKWPEL